ncbi:hypothetical protein [uncultured Rubinisphaera sp.]|uniref:hypothetical protein n=1 Tax=uncultured Rubinisphaera sp. TaxID=1678686 RepID=UPI0030DDB5F6
MSSKRTGKYSLESGRVYVHRKCRKSTCVTGQDFANVCNPFVPAAGTICSSCGSGDKYANFKWEDTDEKLSEYRQRLRDEAPAYLQHLNLIAAGSLAVVMAMLFAVMNLDRSPAIFAAAGFIAGGVCGYLFLAPELTVRLAGKRFYTSR